MDGLFEKYTIGKCDGSPIDPKADYFVLRLDKDPAALVAVLAYARATERKQLAQDILAKYGPADPPAPPAAADTCYLVLNRESGEGVVFDNPEDAEYAATGEEAEDALWPGMSTLADNWRDLHNADDVFEVQEIQVPRT